MGQAHYPFLEMFPFCSPEDGGADEAVLRPFADALVFEAAVDKSAASMDLSVEFSAPPPPVAVSTAEERIALTYNLERVEIKFYIRADAKKEKEKAKSSGEKLLWGKKAKGESAPISSLTPESGRTQVTGQVFGKEMLQGLMPFHGTQ